MRDHTVSIDNSTTPATITYAPTFNVAPSFIDRHVEEGRSDKIIIRSAAGDTVTFGELAENVNRAGNALLGLGIKPGERMLMMIKDSPEFFYAFWGAIKAGIVPVPINTLLRTKDYQFMIEDSGCAGLVYSPEFAGEVEPALENAGHKLGHAFLTDTLKDLMADASGALSAAPASADADCFWLYSSGTTGTPKGAVHAHRDMVETSVHYTTNMFGLKEDDICFSAAKLFFAYGLGNAMTSPLWLGASTVLLPGPPTPDSTFDVIEKFKPTVYYGVPTLYAAQLRALETQSRDLSSLRACISAGEALPADIFRRWQEKTGTVILDGIGSTEALHIFISNVLDDYNPGTSGRVVPGYEAKIIDQNRDEIPVGESGRLIIRGGSIARYYWNNPDKTAETMVDGWLDTGDTYILDEDGYYHYCGRNDDMLKVGGIWCSPFEIEAKLIEHPKVLEAAVVGRADADDLIKPEAFIVLNDPADAGDATSDELLHHCKDGLARYKYPRWFNFVEDLPKTATGKIQRFKLR
ncbi:MAG: benzoate-CoA ligase family protein [Rhodospirillales bacterium]|nr:benzoate-CoA ligase family protein [Rhodospirillales bacterium]